MANASYPQKVDQSLVYQGTATKNVLDNGLGMNLWQKWFFVMTAIISSFFSKPFIPPVLLLSYFGQQAIHHPLILLAVIHLIIVLIYREILKYQGFF